MDRAISSSSARRPAGAGRAARAQGVNARLAPAPPGRANQVLQRKPRIGAVDDPLEHEADRAAERVLRGDAVGPLGGAAEHPQRKCAACEAEDPETLRRQASEEEEEEVLQRKPEAGGPRVTGAEAAAGAVAGGGVPLSAGLRGYFEPRFGTDFSHVRLHTHARAASAAGAIGARAYTLGGDIAFGAGYYAPGTREGRRTLAHELAHVVQQGAGSPLAVRRQPEPLEPPGPEPPVECRVDLLTGRFECCAPLPGVGRVCAPDPRTVRDKIEEELEKLRRPPPGPPPPPLGICPEERRIPSNPPPPFNAGACCPEGTIWTGDGCRVVTVLPNCRPEDCGSDEIFTGLPGALCCIPRAERTTPPPPPPPPPPASFTKSHEIFFELDRPIPGAAGAAAFERSVTAEGQAGFTALVAELERNPALRVQLVGAASSEGEAAYNFRLARRRALMIAEALERAGIERARIADPPERDLRSECRRIAAGVASCGEAGATADPKHRRVLVRVFEKG